MAFDQSTRNRLSRFVSEARALTTEEFTRQMQHEYGLDPTSGDVTELNLLSALDDTRRETARILRETMDYYLGGMQANAKSRQDVLDRIVREQAFTALNRLCALRMVEARGLALESIAQVYQSKGFQLCARLAGSSLGETGDAYRCYLFSLFDEFAVDLPVLFDRFSPQGRLFPRETALLKLLELINDPEIEPLWVEDETIGWSYQYFNSKEERQAMRAASQAPRNSRELAVRNQFFTPRYVVEFLTDNTLGRIWYEMTQGQTGLKDTCLYLVQRPNEIFLAEGEEAPTQAESGTDLSQEELLKQPVYITHRPLKDPREIKMLDPACGSMHFGLYAFDLFEQIYAEAWDLEERIGSQALWRLADLEPLHQTYSNREAFLQDVPRLIIERNIHGIDIDPRAVQIAGLSLWLRAQKNWQAQGLKSHERPSIRKSNIVCAEPMPGDRQMLEEFLATLREDCLETLMRKVLKVPKVQKVRATKAMADAIANLVRTVWQEMELAGEAGSLLKIEETLRDAIASARKSSEEKAPLFQVLEFGLNEPTKERVVQVSVGEEHGFWNQAEALVLAALQEYAVQAENDSSYRRRLYADDATQGFAFIDLSRKRYDVVVMNPPFGASCANSSSKYIKDKYPWSENNLAASFIIRSISSLTTRKGKLGYIADKSLIVRNSYEDLRKNNLISNKLDYIIDLGWNVLDDAYVETHLAVVEYVEGNNNNTVFLDKEALCSVYENKLKGLLLNNAFVHDQAVFNNTPNSTFIYDLPNDLLTLFNSPHLDPNYAHVRIGSSPGDSFRFYRCYWEVKEIVPGWLQVWNGGDFSPIYRPLTILINWKDGGSELKNLRDENGKLRSRPQNLTYYYKGGLSYGKRGNYLNPHIMNSNCGFTDEGQAIIPIEIEDSWQILGSLNSKLHRLLINSYCGQHKHSGYVRIIPFVKFSSELKKIIDKNIKEIFDILRNSWATAPDHALFISPWGKRKERSLNIQNDWKNYDSFIKEVIKRIDELEDNLNRIVYEEYNIQGKSIEYIDTKSKDMPRFSSPVRNLFPSVEHYCAVTIEYLLGVIFGRWDIRYAVLSKDVPNLPATFERLPICPLGMLKDKVGNPAGPEDVPINYPLRISWTGILTEDDGHHDDVVTRLREAISVVYLSNSDEIEAEICELLRVPALRRYFNNPGFFFSNHIRRYSQSQRQAPIYWPLSTPSCSYTLWLYYHRLNDQILFTCVNDFVDPKLNQVSEEAARLRLKKGRSAAEENGLERLTDFERELKDFRLELLRVAAFWKPNLNDGVEITAAPLWKLFQHKPWQKKLKETWEKLEGGEYDWAHLAYSIWPERVRKKCKTDKSLAIAHDLEHLFKEPKVSLKKKKVKIQAEMELEDLFDED